MKCWQLHLDTTQTKVSCNTVLAASSVMVQAFGSADGLHWARAPAKTWIRNEGRPAIRELGHTEM